ncbi:MAG: putative ABC exporter domain-containing protein [Defluviitaleaceae bacterium]|nr:putative ABC exporter domain-containing protein [Defluviitaleaceae bacterium]
MNSLTYLLYCGTKNRIKETFRKPAKLIVYILAIGFLLFLAINALRTELPNVEDYTEPNTLLIRGFLFVFFLTTFFTTSLAGLKGTSQYGMEDVNFLFVAPIRARTILLYGIMQSAKTILMGSWFVVLQVGWLRRSFGIGLDGVALLWIGYVLFALACQILSIFLYAMTNGNARRISIAKAILLCAFAPVVVRLFFHLIANDWDFIGAISALLHSPVINSPLLVGWAVGGVMAFITGEILLSAFFVGLITALGAVLFVIIFVKEPDYYEHVAGATQTTFENARAVESGDIQSVMGASNKNARVKGIGISRGVGASVFLSKHLRESFRNRRFGPWGIPSLLYIAGAGVFAFIAKGNYNISSEIVVLGILGAMLVIGFFSMSMGRGMLEIHSHYIFMIPENPFKKWLWANMELIFKVAVEAVLIFGVAGLILWDMPVNFAVAGIVYVAFAFYSLGTTLAFMRITGIASRSLILSFLIIFLYVLPLVPGLAFAIIIAVLLNGAITAAMIFFALWLLAIGLGCFALSKGMLHNCDMISMDGIIKELQQIGG